MQFANRMDAFGVGIFSQLAQMRAQRVSQGLPVVDLSVGAPNIAPAPHIMQALSREALVPENYLYALGDTQALREAVAAWYLRRYGVTLDPASEIVSLLGSQEGLAHIALSIVDPGDIVLVPDPCYPIFADGPRLAGASLYPMPQRAENGYLIDLDEIPPSVAQKAKLMVVSYPNNPTAVLAPDGFYHKLIAFAAKYDIIVLHDNAYSELVFDGASCGSFLAYPGAKEVGVEFNSLSKTYGLAGARCGFCVGCRAVVERLSLLKSNLDYGMFLPIQKAAIAAITGDQSCVEATRQAYQQRRDVLVEGLNALGWPVQKPQATMFVWAKLPHGFADDRKFVQDLLRESGLIVTPGSAFGALGKGHVRMALVQDNGAVQGALETLRQSSFLSSGKGR